jgi:DNA (cytosine-5)-methyltransferase 1
MVNFLSLFSGIGAFEKALDRLGVEYKLVNYCEIDKYASKSYSAVHNVPESLNLGDITKVNTNKLPRVDMVSYGFPCQDISLAGKQKGLFNEDGTQTRSGLFFEALRIIEDTKPKVAIAENVKNLTSKKFNAQFQIVLESLEQAGYNNYWQVLNAKDYGVPQNRERVFIVSIRKDIDTGFFKFPEPFGLELRLKDLLEAEADEKYYLSDKGVNYVLSPKRGMCTDINPDVIQPLTAKGQSNWTGSFVSPDIKEVKKSSTIGSTEPVQLILKNGTTVLVRENTKKGYTEAYEGDSINFEQPNSKTRRGRVGKQVAQTLTTSPQQCVVTDKLRIRKLTPLECWRLMGFDDEDFYKAEKVNSNTQLYKQAGNSIVVDVLEYLFKEIMEVLDMKKVEDKVIVYECDDLINLEALKEKEPELYEELLADYPAESATYVFKNQVV